MTGWNPHSVHYKAFETAARILVNARFRGSPTTFSILNYYGPYSNREAFWSMARAGGLLSLPSLILAEDLNFTLNAGEIWGNYSQLDPLAPLFYSTSLRPSFGGPFSSLCRPHLEKW